MQSQTPNMKVQLNSLEHALLYKFYMLWVQKIDTKFWWTNPSLDEVLDCHLEVFSRLTANILVAIKYTVLINMSTVVCIPMW